ncbi:MAG TPA: hypothetical protein VKB12_06715 [Pyrinomonadaceae bacterium]|nr:hypothetical protein [Pyrinomonadaceae bacterium]
MPGRTLPKQREAFEAEIRGETDPDLKKIKLEAYRRYYMPRDRTKDIILVFVGFIIIALTVIFSFSFLSFFAAVGVIIGMFALLCLMMGVMLRVWGDITSNDLLTLVREGFKALFLLRRGPNQGGGDEGGGPDEDSQS